MQHRFDDILAFLQAIETHSISAAAQRLGLSKSVVSKRISDLETKLKVKLLHRSTRGVVATDKGAAFYQRARAIMQQLDQASEALLEQDEDLCGVLRIAAPMSFGTSYLGPILFSFINHYPRLKLALELNDQITDLSGEGYDLGIRIGRLRDSTLIARKLAVSRRIACCSPAYAQRAGLPVTIEELANHACIGYSNVSPSQIWQFESAEPGGPPVRW
ncbi:LysR family transcriptional regulator [Nitrosomonas sp. ANs5]|uniref:LysR family transcriptional regulator n=1 Tax=Nitrosomonas sp. ANs5 TaxID=3423941 RepID=UPI003D3433CC